MLLRFQYLYMTTWGRQKFAPAISVFPPSMVAVLLHSKFAQTYTRGIKKTIEFSYSSPQTPLSGIGGGAKSASLRDGLCPLNTRFSASNIFGISESIT